MITFLKTRWQPVLAGFAIFGGDMILFRLIEQQPPLVATLFALVLSTGAIFLARYLHLLSKKEEFKDAWNLVFLAGGLAGLFVFKIIGALIMISQYGIDAMPDNQQAIMDLNMPPYLLFVTVVIMAPFVEEFIFRGVIMGKVFGRTSIIGLVLSSLLFGYLHGPTDLGSWIIYGGMGLALGLVYRFSRRWEMAVAVHMINNLIGFIGILLMSR